jgi:SiaC family regulatory phosphoprotein
MKKYSIESTVKTPSISLDFGTGVLEVKGRSFPENAIEFYKPLFDALEEYTSSAKSDTRVNFQLEDFDTASAK